MINSVMFFLSSFRGTLQRVFSRVIDRRLDAVAPIQVLIIPEHICIDSIRLLSPVFNSSLRSIDSDIANVTMPSTTQMTLTSIWLESIAYGINCALFSRSTSVLLRRQARDGLKYSSRFLLVASTFLVITATVHMILSFLQLLKGFTDSAILSKPLGTDVYLVSNTLLVINLALYVANAITQELLLIWRLYVILNRSRIACVLPVVILIGNAISGYMGIYHFSQSPGSMHPLKAFILSYWITGFFLNAMLTCTIARYIWRVSRDAYGMNRSDYRSAVRFVVESGALVTSCALVMTCLYIAGSVAGPISENVAIQLNTANPLLIVARVGTHVNDSASHSTFILTRPIDFRVDAARPRSVDSLADPADASKYIQP
ncbi:hypothetical protein SERLA73DRAFT_77871 [Serpula lacrymans var. lacrymans S7.3]|uniref:Uncharacterized protein n=2 Tax=Serpula lacrymans var. lacrymans TaxID=341189 RepID=F8QB96_SERL3|nr:uncharacterized protein SERLADRAFT_442775 [Serpula lacrymans var. lacrymans S7.9]EGN94482.1 hypothetical protein SERLA73DRAFT_77871 [Serpula lacrymans var. lacrymans S7.3]EGO19961.1 hypothetical protein SERLADRAFT_442775 [Serpula lacrymans var. lacrymans S7.9]